MNTFFENFLSNFISDSLIAIIFGVYITKKIDLSKRISEEKKNKKEDREKLKMIVNILWSEIEFNRNQLNLMISNLPKANMIYPALETSAWEIVDKKICNQWFESKKYCKYSTYYNGLTNSDSALRYNAL